MAPRRSRPTSEASLDLSALREDPSSPASRDELRTLLAKEPGRVVAQVAKILRSHSLDGFEADLIATLDRLIAEGAAADMGCVGKVAVLEALDFSETLDAAPFLRSVRYAQPEAAWGPPIDSAAGVRGRSIQALARIRHPDFLLHAAELLLDPDPPVREAAADALSHYGGSAAAALVLLKIRHGDAEPSVMLACFSALLGLAPPGFGLTVVRDALRSPGRDVSEAAAFSLGESRREDAIDCLLEELSGTQDGGTRKLLIRAIALHRSERAIGAVLQIIRVGPAQEAENALQAVRPRAAEAGLREQLTAAIEASRAAEKLKRIMKTWRD